METHPDETEYPASPKALAEGFREIVTRNFSVLGSYNSTAEKPLNVGGTSVTCGHGLDDLTDIAADLEEVLWRWERNREPDAIWYFRFGYETPWGRHLNELRLYLFALAWGQ